MKKLINLSAIVSLGILASANAGIVTGTDIIDGAGNDIIITDNTGTPIDVGMGFVSLGYFSITDGDVDLGLNPGDLKTTLGNFQVLTSATMTAEGMYFLTTDYGKGTLDAESGKTLYTLMGEAADTAASNEFILYRHNDVIDADGGTPTDDSNDMTLDDGSLLFGTVGGAKTVDATNLLGNASYMSSISYAMEVVPEPSSTALLGLGGVALMLRRRR